MNIIECRSCQARTIIWLKIDDLWHPVMVINADLSAIASPVVLHNSKCRIEIIFNKTGAPDACNDVPFVWKTDTIPHDGKRSAEPG
jgi:hypothetical protein